MIHVYSDEAEWRVTDAWGIQFTYFVMPARRGIRQSASQPTDAHAAPWMPGLTRHDTET
jgi:hypothetical protein